MIYLDYSANTPADPAVLRTFVETEQRYIGNANSTHAAGRAAHARMDEILAHTAQLLGVQPDELIFTSGASEANNLALKGMARVSRHVGKHIIDGAGAFFRQRNLDRFTGTRI